MDIISFNEASTANGRIESFIENPDSTSGVLTVPKTIAAGETITIPAGRVAILPDLQVDGDLVVDGDLFIPTGSMTSQVVQKVTSTDNAVVRFDGTTGQVQNSAITIDDSGNIGSGTQSFNGFGGSGFKNYIINGNFDVWQYGTSQTTTGYGSDDRWSNNQFGSTKTHSQITCTDTERLLFNASKFSRTVVSSVVGASNSVIKRTAIEDVARLAGKTVTVSFWAKADSAKNIWLEFLQTFGTGGSPSATVAGLYAQAIPLTSTWQKKTATITLPSIIGKTLGTDGVHTSSTLLQFWFDVGSSNTGRIPTGMQQSGTFDIAQVQLEEGSVATPFERRPYGLELSLCQRYYEKVDSTRCNIPVYGTGTGFIGSVKYKVPKRTVPTISLGTASHWRTIVIYTGFALSTLNVQDTTAYGFDVSGTSSGGNITAGYAGRIQVNDEYVDNGKDGIFVSAEL